MTLTAAPRLRVAHEGKIARVLIDNAGKRNAFDLAMWQALPGVMSALDADPGVRVIILSGAAGQPFCSGADISEFSTVRASAEGGRLYEAANAAAFDALARCAKPVIASIRGFCLGGGMGLAAACDLRVAAEGTIFGIPAARLGLGYPPSAMAYIVAAVGAQAARDLFFTARRIDAGEAKALGFLARLVKEDQLDAEVAALARVMADNAPLTIAAAKAAIARAAGLPVAVSAEEADAIAAASFDSADYAEGRQAFLEKRAPRFEGR